MASVAPYMTNSCQPLQSPSAAKLRTRSGEQSPAGLGDVAQIGQIGPFEADPLEHVECVGHPGERGAAVPAEQRPELVVDDRAVGQDQRGSTEQVAVDHREAVAV